MKKLLILLGIFAALTASFFVLNTYIYNEKQADDEDSSIASFEECVSAGYPVLESFPEQCVTQSGKRFTKNIPEEDLVGVSTDITIRGSVVCLPHWDTSGPQTLECALGLLSETGDYYGLRDEEDENGSIISSLPTGSSIEIRGTYIPGSLEKYQSIGVIEIESVEVL